MVNDGLVVLGLRVIAVGWQVWVSLIVRFVLCKLELLLAVGLPLWVALVADGLLCRFTLRMAAVGWPLWLALVVRSMLVISAFSAGVVG